MPTIPGYHTLALQDEVRDLSADVTSVDLTRTESCCYPTSGGHAERSSWHSCWNSLTDLSFREITALDEEYFGGMG